MFAYCNNNPANYCDYSGNSPFTPNLNLLDYKTIHELVQERLSYEEGWYVEVSVNGELGRGRLDLFDADNNTYYEVKSKGAADKYSTKTQMKKYDVAMIYGMYSSIFEQDSPATRGTEQVSGEFRYGFWDVKYEYKEPGLIVYTPTYNKAREATFAAVGAAIISALSYLVGGSGSFASAPVPGAA